MSQSIDYPYTVMVTDGDVLAHVVDELMRERLRDRERHLHNFEVWLDEAVIRVNDLGLECVKRIYEDDYPGITPILDARLSEAAE